MHLDNNFLPLLLSISYNFVDLLKVILAFLPQDSLNRVEHPSSTKHKFVLHIAFRLSDKCSVRDFGLEGMHHDSVTLQQELRESPVGHDHAQTRHDHGRRNDTGYLAWGKIGLQPGRRLRYQHDDGNVTDRLGQVEEGGIGDDFYEGVPVGVTKGSLGEIMQGSRRRHGKGTREEGDHRTQQATCMVVRLTPVALSGQTKHRRSPRLGMDAPFATSYSRPRSKANDGMIGIASAVVLGMTVSHEPESAVSST